LFNSRGSPVNVPYVLPPGTWPEAGDARPDGGPAKPEGDKGPGSQGYRGALLLKPDIRKGADGRNRVGTVVQLNRVLIGLPSCTNIEGSPGRDITPRLQIIGMTTGDPRGRFEYTKLRGRQIELTTAVRGGGVKQGLVTVKMSKIRTSLEIAWGEWRKHLLHQSRSHQGTSSDTPFQPGQEIQLGEPGRG